MTLSTDHFQYLIELSEASGPTPEEYGKLMDWFRTTMTGILSPFVIGRNR
jgi:hypothetical protein